MASSRETVFALSLVVASVISSVIATGHTEKSELCENVIGATTNGTGACVCEEKDYIIDSSYSHCIPDRFQGWGSDCEDPIQCKHMGNGAVCKDGSCSCTEGYHYLQGNCWRDKKHGENCLKNEECYAYFESDAYVCSKGNICECAEGAYKFRDKEGSVMCRRKAMENEECETPEDCWETDTTCEKREGTATDFVCTLQDNDSEASSSLISTIRTLKTINSNANLGETKGRCTGPNEEETSGGNCVCMKGYYKPSGTSICYPELGTPCSLPGDTEKAEPESPHIEFATCRRSAKSADTNSTVGVLACLGGFLPNSDNHECQKTRTIKQNCFEDVTCAYYGGVCNGKSCVCPEGFHYVQSKTVCWPSKGINETCADHFDCGVTTDDSIQCNGGLCECKKGFHEAKGDCRKEAQKLGDKCTDITDCVFAKDDSLIKCTTTCSCITGYFKINDTNCETGIGGNCTEDSCCAAVNNTKCFNDTEKLTCQCETGFVSGGTTKFCYPVATEYEEECEEDDQCTQLTTDGNNIECPYDVNPRVCRCKNGYYYKNKLCWEKKFLREECHKESQCFPENSYCFKNLCTCQYGFKPLGDKCVDDNGANTATSFSFILVTLLVFVVNILR